MRGMTDRHASSDHAVDRPAFQAVVLAARTVLSEAEQERLRCLAAGPLDWNEVVWLTGYHQVTPLVLRNLERYVRAAVPGRHLRVLQAETRRIGVQGQFLLQELGRLMQRFEAAGLPMLVLKGPVIAQVAYGHLGLRAFKDMDILVRPADYPAVRALLEREEYVPFPQVAERARWQQWLHRWYVRQVPFMRGVKTFYVDLHLAPLPALYYFPLDVETLMERGSSESIGRFAVPVPKLEDHLLILCYHGEKNRWERLKYVCDLAELLRRHEDRIDWDEIETVTRRIQGRRIVGMALWLARELMDAPVPPALLAPVRTSQAVRDLGSELVRRLAEQRDTGLLPFSERVALHWHLQDSILNKLRYAFFSMVRTMS